MGAAEHETIGEVLRGDRDRYDVLVREHYQLAFRLAFRITGNPDDAEEVTQEAFLRAYTRLHSFREQASFSTWVNRIVIHTALNLIERRRRDVLHAGVEIEDTRAARTGFALQVADGAAGPERLLLEREAIATRHAAMDALTPMERTAFTLRHMEELPIAEIAAALRIPANSAKQAVFRAVSKLRVALAPAAGGVR